MSEERPTNQRLKKARQRGEVAKSSFLAGAILFLGAILLLRGLCALFFSGFQKSLRIAFSYPLSYPLQDSLEGVFFKVVAPLLQPTLYAMVGMVVLAIGAHLLQTGPLFSIKKIEPKWGRKKTERRFFFPLFVLALLTLCAYLMIRTKLNSELLFYPIKGQIDSIFKKIFLLSYTIGIVFLFLGLGDFFYQKWRFHKKMRMSTEEKRREQRESEGDPRIKNARRGRR